MSARHARPHPLLAEGLMLFFPVAALHAVASPLLWVAAFGYQPPFAGAVPGTQWHAHEMIFGTYAAALAGFLCSAIPEWTNTPPRRGGWLLGLLALWLTGRVVGLLGIEALLVPALLLDTAFWAMLMVTVAVPVLGRRRGGSFLAWLCVLGAAQAAVKLAWWMGEPALSARLLHAALAAFVVLLTLALTRVGVVVINLALDPSGETTPYRPHPGRRNLSGFLAAAQGVAALLLPDSLVGAWLALAAGAAFLDRLAEWFIGRAALRSEVLALGAANGFAGLGFLALGVAGLGGPVSAGTGTHLLAVASLGLAVMAVFVIAGLRHSGRDLVLPWSAHAAFALVALAGLVRTVPELLPGLDPPGGHHLVAALLWSAAFAMWLAGFLPLLRNPVGAGDGCGAPTDVTSSATRT